MINIQKVSSPVITVIIIQGAITLGVLALGQGNTTVKWPGGPEISSNNCPGHTSEPQAEKEEEI